jgi:hypothetical protein
MYTWSSRGAVDGGWLGEGTALPGSILVFILLCRSDGTMLEKKVEFFRWKSDFRRAARVNLAKIDQ